MIANTFAAGRPLRLSQILRSGFTCIALAVIGAEAVVAQEIEPEDEPGLYCRLGSSEMQERLGEVRGNFLVHVRGVEELENGYRYRFEKSTDRMQTLTEFIDFESRCCAFMRFDLSVEAGAQEISLSLTGPAGTKELLESMMTSVEFDWRAGEDDNTGEAPVLNSVCLTSEIADCFRRFVGE